MLQMMGAAFRGLITVGMWTLIGKCGYALFVGATQMVPELLAQSLVMLAAGVLMYVLVLSVPALIVLTPVAYKSTIEVKKEYKAYFLWLAAIFLRIIPERLLPGKLKKLKKQLWAVLYEQFRDQTHPDSDDD
jgi:hypothetical protein